jgi:hypothetical protein
MTHPNSERGFALAAAVFALVIIAALVAGAFFAARQELTVGRSSLTFQRAFSAAEAGLNSTVAEWNAGTYNALAVGDSVTVSGTLPNNTGSYSGVVRKLNTQLFLIRSVGQDPSGSASRTVAAIARLQQIAIDFNASLTTRGSVKLGGSSLIDGRDDPPDNWGCPTTGLDTLPGVLLNNESLVETAGCTPKEGDYKCIVGDPDVQEDPTISDSTFFKFGDLTWDDLVAMATKVYPPGDVGPLNQLAPVGTATTCNTEVMDNWGEPGVSPTMTIEVPGCRYYFPIIYVSGNLKITGGRGQGILLVEGDLEVQGGAEFYGPVIVRGVLTTAGQGGHFTGGVFAANVDLTEQSSILGDAVLTYSSCAITQALQYNASGRLIRQRSWAEIF